MAETKLINAQELGRLLDLSEVSVHDLVKRNIIPKEGRGKFHPFKCIVFYIRHLREQAAGRGGTDLTDERARLAKEQADRIEMENKVTRGELITIAEIRKENDYLATSIKNKAEALPIKIAPLLLGIEEVSEARSILKNAIKECLTEISKLET